MRKQQEPAEHTLSYIKSVMTKSEVSFREFGQFFLWLSVCSLVSGFGTALFRSRIYSQQFQTGDLFRDVLVNTLLECGCKIVLLIPIVILIRIFNQKVKRKNQGISLWLFRAIAFVIVFCGSLLPVATTAVSADYEGAELFSILTCSLCMLLFGIFTEHRALKTAAYITLAIPLVVLSALGVLHLYYQYLDSQHPIPAFAVAFGYTKSFFYIIYPAVGYLVLSVFSKSKSKGMSDREL